MGAFRKLGFVNRLILSSTLIAAPLSGSPSPQSQVNINLADINFAYRISQIVEKVYKAAEVEDQDYLINLMLEAKKEVEIYTGKIISLNQEVDLVKKNIEEKGVVFSKKEFDSLKNKLLKKESRHNHKATYLENCFYAGIPYNVEEEDLIFSSFQLRKDSNDTEVDIPIRLTVGVTVALIGLFIVIVPIVPPPLKAYGAQMIAYGAALAAEPCYTAYDENQKKQQ